MGLNWIQDAYKRKLVAYYYNKGEEWGKEVEILYKENHLPPGVVGKIMNDNERMSQLLTSGSLILLLANFRGDIFEMKGINHQKR